MASAEAAFRLAIDSSDDFAAEWAAINLWILLSRQGDLRGSQVAYLKAINLIGTGERYSSIAEVSSEIGSRLGVGGYGIDYGVRDYGSDLTPGARAAYQHAIASEHCEGSPIAAVGLGAMLVAMHDWAGARAAYQHALDSGHPDCAPMAVGWLNKLGEVGPPVVTISTDSSFHLEFGQPDVRRPPQASATPFIEELFAEFGRNLPEDREIDATIQAGIDLIRPDVLADPGGMTTNSENWDTARRIFKAVQKKHPDYDVPYVWLAEYLRRTQGPSRALAMLKGTAKKCRRKHNLLAQAAELSLLECSDVRGAIHLFAQCISSMEAKPDRGQLSVQRACLFLRELFVIFGDSVGASWAKSMQSYTSLEESLIARIRQTVETRLTRDDRDIILRELPEIRDHLCTIFPAA